MEMEFDHFTDYAAFLEVITGHLCPFLVEDLMKFYRRVRKRQGGEPTVYHASSLRDLAKALDSLEVRKDNDNDIEQARRWFLHRTINDADAVLYALETRIREARTKKRLLPGHQATAVDTIRFCILYLAEKIDKSNDENDQSDKRQ